MCVCLQAKQKEVAAVLTKAPSDVVVDGGAPGVAIHPLADAWNEVNKQMEYRKLLLDQSVAFHSSAIQVLAAVAVVVLTFIYPEKIIILLIKTNRYVRKWRLLPILLSRF